MEIKISFHYLGCFFKRDNRLLYRKGEVHVTRNYDSDLLSYFELLDMLKEETGVVQVKELWYLPVGTTMNDGLTQIKADADIRSMVDHVSADGVAHVYVVLEGECSPSFVLAETGQNTTTSSECLAIVVYEGGNRVNVDAAEEVGGRRYIPTQDSTNIPPENMINEEVPEEFMGDDLDVSDEDRGSDCSDDSDDLDFSVKDCDYKESDEDEADLFFDSEGELEHMDDDIRREFDFENVTGIEVDPESEVEADSDGLKTPDCSDEDEGEKRKFIVFNHLDGFAGPIHLEEGMLFATKEIFKKAITQSSVERGGDFYYLHNDKKKINVLCKNKCDCPWKHCRRSCGAKGCGKIKCNFRAAARLYSDDGTFQLKSIVGEHNCGRQFFNGRVKSKYLAEKYLDQYKDDPEMKLRVFMNTVRRDLGVKINYAHACRTRQKAFLMIQGDAREQYALICDYAEILIKYRVADSAYVHCHGSIEKPIFQRFFVCLRACSRGFFLGCRRIIRVDGCHLRGAHSGQILSAVGKDANDNIYPVAYAIVESECKETWGWFLQNLMPELGDFELCVTSDRQKGLLEALKDVAPMTEQRFCVRHLYGNFRTKFGGGVAMRALIWQAARATRRVNFEAAMKAIRDKSPEAADWLMEKGVSSWSRHAFKEFCKADMLLNNICESWNNFILEARDKPILTCCEWIRRSLMRRMAKKKHGILQWQGRLTPKAQTKLEIAKKIGQEKCNVTIGGHNRYDVELNNDVFIVDMNKFACSCNRWALTGIPCPHAAVVILSTRGLVLENYVDKYYTKEMWLLAYEENISTMPGRKEWEKSVRPPPQPPVFKVQPGRTKKKRRREEGEEGPPKKGRAFTIRKYRCRMCGTEGHTKKSCPRNPNRIIPQRRRKQPGRKRKTAHSTEDIGTSGTAQDPEDNMKNSAEPREQAPAHEDYNDMATDEIPDQGLTDHNTQPQSTHLDFDDFMAEEDLRGEPVKTHRKQKRKNKGKGVYIGDPWDEPGRYRWEEAPVTGSIPTSPAQWSWGRSKIQGPTEKAKQQAEDDAPDATTAKGKGKEKEKQPAVPPKPADKPVRSKIGVSPEYKRSSRLRSLVTCQLRRKPLWKI